MGPSGASGLLAPIAVGPVVTGLVAPIAVVWKYNGSVLADILSTMKIVNIDIVPNTLYSSVRVLFMARVCSKRGKWTIASQKLCSSSLHDLYLRVDH